MAENRSSVIRLAYSTYAPGRFACAKQSLLASTKQCPLPGPDSELLSWVLKGAGLTPELIDMPYSYIKEHGGFINGLYAFINSEHIDAGSQPFTINSDRLAKYEHSFVIPAMQSVAAVTFANTRGGMFDNTDQWFRLLWIFEFPVWVMLLGAMFFMAVMLLVHRKWMMKLSRRSDTLQKFNGKIVNSKVCEKFLCRNSQARANAAPIRKNSAVRVSQHGIATEVNPPGSAMDEPRPGSSVYVVTETAPPG